MNARSLALVAAAGIFGAAMLTVPAADASTEIRTDQAEAKGSVARLEAYDSITRFLPKPGKAHEYRASLEPAIWSVIALQPPSTGDMDLEVFADKAHTKSLGRSAFGTGLADFVAVDRSLVGHKEVFPQAQAYSGSAPHMYSVELAPSLGTLGSSPKNFSTVNGNVVRVYDTHLVAGVTYTFVLDPADTTSNGDLFLMGSTPGDPSTGVKTRIDALKVGAAQGWGGTETFTFTPTVSDHYGVVVITNGFGGYKLSRTS